MRDVVHHVTCIMSRSIITTCSIAAKSLVLADSVCKQAVDETKHYCINSRLIIYFLREQRTKFTQSYG